MAKEHRTRRQSLLACRNERDPRCSRILLRILPITLKQVKFRSLIDEEVGGPSVTCGPHHRSSTPCAINLKVSFVLSHKRDFLWNFCCLFYTSVPLILDYDQLAKDFTRVFLNQEPSILTNAHLFDVVFLVGQQKQKARLIGVRAILGVRSRVFQVTNKI